MADAHVLPASAAPTSALEPVLAMTTGPTLIQRLLSGNVFAKIGILILFIGVSFLITP
ncbi:MAG: hypothetical protein ABIS68_00415 [Casimicrobiaceae bacterium]